MVVAVALATAGCGGGSSIPRPNRPFAEALTTVGGGGANGSLGVGWAEPRRIRGPGLGRELIADALGPNAATVIEQAPQLRRRFGFNPMAAERLISIGGSYAFGLRLDGVDAQGLQRTLVEAGARQRDEGQVDLVNAADYAVVPEPLLRAGISGLGARDAFTPKMTMLTISDTARDALLGRGNRLIDEPTYAAAAHCLGDVVVARMIPDELLLSTDLGVNSVAMGVSGAKREVLCVLGGSPQRTDEVASALDRSLAPDAREPVTHEPIGDAVAKARVSRESYAGVQAVRAELTLAAGQSPGFLFETVSHGSLPRMIGGA